MSSKRTIGLLSAVCLLLGCAGPSQLRMTSTGAAMITEVPAVSREMANPLSLIGFAATSNPIAAALHPNGTQAFVVLGNRNELVRVVDLNGAPQIDGAVQVGVRPVGLALSSDGQWAVVPDFAGASVTLVNTGSMTGTTIPVGMRPTSVAISGDDAWVALSDGALVQLKLGSGTVGASIALETIEAEDGACMPSQVSSVTISEQRAFVSARCAGSSGAVSVSVVDLLTQKEVGSHVLLQVSRVFRRAYLYGADLKGADLRGVDLYKCQLGSANLANADLRNASLAGAYLFNTDLRGADLRGARFSPALKGAELKQTGLVGARFDESTELPFSREEALRRGMIAVGSNEEVASSF